MSQHACIYYFTVAGRLPVALPLHSTNQHCTALVIPLGAAGSWDQDGRLGCDDWKHQQPRSPSCERR
jgi:hypothetical protein